MNERSATSRLSFLSWLLPLALAFAVAFSLYSPVLRGELVSDDLRFIADNGRNLDLVATAPWRFFTDKNTVATPPDRDIYRPLRTLSFALDRKLFGSGGTAFHSHNVALHALAAFLLLLLLRGIPAVANGAAAGALFFLVHPLATEAVAWISSRSDLQACVFVLLALLFARRAEVSGNPFMVLLLGAACGFAKETAVVVPLLYLVEHRLRRGRFDRSSRLPFVALGIGVAVHLAVYLAVRDRGIRGQIDWYGGSFASHLPYALLGIARQIRLLAIPTPLDFMYEPGVFAAAAKSALSIAGAVATILVAAVIVVFARRRAPALTFGAIFFAIALLPAANLVLPLRTVLAERFAYVPLLGAAIAFSGIAAWVRSQADLRVRRIALACGLAGFIAFSWLTHSRAGEFQTSEQLYRATVRDWPDSYSGALGLGDILLAKGEYDAAIEQMRRAESLSGGDRALRIKASFARGRAQGIAKDHPAAVATLSPLVSELDSDPALSASLRDLECEIRYVLGAIYSDWRRLDEAAKVFDALIARCGETAPRLDALAEVERYRVGDVKKILALYHRAIELDPEYAKARIHLALMWHEFPTMRSEAIRQLREVLARASSSPDERAQAQALLDSFLREPK